MTVQRQVNVNTRRIEQLMRDIRLDVERRTKNSKNITEWTQNLSPYINNNCMVTGTHAAAVQDFVNGVADTVNQTKLPAGSNPEIVKGVMAEACYTYVTNVGEDLKTEMQKNAVECYNKGLAPSGVAKELGNKIQSMSDSRCRTIARTETMRASSLAQYLRAKQRGMKSYIIECHEDACPVCIEAYGENQNGTEFTNPTDMEIPETTVFDIEDTDMLPPIHPNCRCTARYSMEEPPEVEEETVEETESINEELQTPPELLDNLTTEQQDLYDKTVSEYEDMLKKSGTDEIIKNGMTADELISTLEHKLKKIKDTSLTLAEEGIKLKDKIAEYEELQDKTNKVNTDKLTESAKYGMEQLKLELKGEISMLKWEKGYVPNDIYHKNKIKESLPEHQEAFKEYKKQTKPKEYKFTTKLTDSQAEKVFSLHQFSQWKTYKENVKKYKKNLKNAQTSNDKAVAEMYIKHYENKLADLQTEGLNIINANKLLEKDIKSNLTSEDYNKYKQAKKGLSEAKKKLKEHADDINQSFYEDAVTFAQNDVNRYKKKAYEEYIEKHTAIPEAYTVNAPKDKVEPKLAKFEQQSIRNGSKVGGKSSGSFSKELSNDKILANFYKEKSKFTYDDQSHKAMERNQDIVQNQVNYPKAERDVATSWGHSGYYDINGSIYSPENYSQQKLSELKLQCELLDSCINRSPRCVYDMIVTRFGLLGDENAALNVGDRGHFKGYGSTGYTAQHGFNTGGEKYEMKIYIPAGSRGMRINQYFKALAGGAEQEWLHGREMDFIIVEKDDINHKCSLLFLTD